jgi:hypothetical protein
MGPIVIATVANSTRRYYFAALGDFSLTLVKIPGIHLLSRRIRYDKVPFDVDNPWYLLTNVSTGNGSSMFR